jgi:transcriptional regulator with XRE-family HTH domain
MPHPRDASLALGVAVRRLREQRGVTQEDLAHDAQVTTGTLSKLERGQSDPAFSTIVKVAAALGVCLGEIGAAVDAEQR